MSKCYITVKTADINPNTRHGRSRVAKSTVSPIKTIGSTSTCVFSQ